MGAASATYIDHAPASMGVGIESPVCNVSNCSDLCHHALPMSDTQRLPIRVLLARLVILGLLPVAVLSAWAIVNTINSQRYAAQQAVLQLSRALAGTVDADLESTRRSLAAMARSDALMRGDIREFYGEAVREIAARPEWAAMILTNVRGEVLFKTSLPFDAKPASVVDPASLERAIKTGAPVVGDLLHGSARDAFAVRVPVVVGGRLVYVLTAAVAPDRLVEVLRRQKAPHSWALAVFDSAGVRVARSKDQAGTVGGRGSPELVRLLAQNKDEGVGVTRTFEGDEVFTGYTRLLPDRWTVVAGAPTSDLNRVLLGSIAWYLGGVVGSLLVCMLLTRRISGRIGSAVARIRDEALQLSAGQEVVAVQSGISELDDIALALNAASQALADHARSVREALSKADAAGQAKDEFLAVLGHELRNPLAPMLTALHLIDMKFPEAAQRERQIMRRQINHMRRLVDDLLDVSRITRGKLEIRREPVEMRAVIERALETFESALQARSRPVEVDAGADPIWVSGDETRLIQAVANLLSNALRYGGEGRIHLTLDKVHGRARVRVLDEGVGMTPETLERVFDPFYQAPQSAARQVGGLGLGLAIVRSIVSLHDGTVIAGSAGPGLGSWFVIEIPTATHADDAATQAPTHAQRRKGRVAVVDDNADALETLAEALRAAGHEVHAMSDAHEALARIPAIQPDVAILDLGMPGLSGIELAAALRSATPRWNGRLVALTGYGRQSDVEQARIAGFASHLTKPADISTLLSEIERLVRPSA